MPLFIIISGYLFSKKIDNAISPLIIKQFRRLIIPNIVWGGGALITSVIITSTIPDFVDIIKLPTFCWFLSSLFVCSVIYAIIYRIGIRNYVVATILLSLASLLIPGNEFVKFFIPFFGIGLILERINIVGIRLKWNVIIILGCIIFIAYLFFWSRNFYIYCTQNPSLVDLDATKWVAYFSRILFGCLISIWLILLFEKIGKIKYDNLLNKLSQNSLGIYVIHYTLFSIFREYITLKLHYNGWIIVVAMFIVSVILVFAINIVIHYLRVKQVTSMLFLGEPRRIH